MLAKDLKGVVAHCPTKKKSCFTVAAQLAMKASDCKMVQRSCRMGMGGPTEPCIGVQVGLWEFLVF